MSQDFVGPLTVSSELGIQGGSLEFGATLGPTPETPYLDFHFGLGVAQDFNVRLINTADNRLDLVTEAGGPVWSVNADKVGIGTTAPGAKLVVQEALAGAELRVDGNNGAQSLSLGADANHPWVGTRTNHDLRLLTNNTEHVRVQADGHVGIGASQASQRLTLGAGNILLPAGNTDTDGNLYFGGITGAGATGLRLFGGLVNGSMPAGFIDVRTTDPNDGLRIRVDTSAGATERVRVTAAGNVGIGTPHPGAPLHVANHMVVGPFVAGGGQGAIEATGPVAELGFVRRSLTAWPAFPAPGDRFAWYNPDGTARLWTEARGDLMIVTAQGNVGIGTFPTQKLHVAGAFLQVNGAGNEQVYIGGDGAGADVQLGSMNPSVQNVAVWNQAASRRMTLFAADFIKVSDARQKTNIRDISHALEQVKRLRGIIYEPLDEEPQPAGVGTRNHLGFIAQEVNAILPEVVSQDSKGMYGISYTSVLPLLVEAVKEQQQHIVNLQEELAALKAGARNTTLSAKAEAAF